MILYLDYTNKKIKDAQVKISGSKSESNRLLILKQWFSNLELKNISDSDDTHHLQAALTSNKELIDIDHAGTAMRFLTSFFACKKGREVVLTGSERMQNRPIKILVDALRMLGADIEYESKEGYPPLKIKGKRIVKDKVAINGNVSSQYISSLLLIAPTLETGLEITLLGEITSRPYLEMTLALLNQIGVKTEWSNASIKVFPKKQIEATKVVVESDWSSASYYYSLIALSEVGTSIELSSYKKDSLQGDSCLTDIYKNFGVTTEFGNNSIVLRKITTHNSKLLTLNLQNAPDIAQTIAVTCFGLGVSCNLTGLHTLKIKETDRLIALQDELQKLGAAIEVTNTSLYLKESSKINSDVAIKTYNDHRMAMAFAPLALKVPITILDAEVVTKSYLHFWKDLAQILS